MKSGFRPAIALAAAAILLALAPSRACAFDPDPVFTQYAMELSAETVLTRFGPRLNDPNNIVQNWNLTARFSLLPFGITRSRFLDGAFDGAVELGVGPTFERFQTEGQNFAGLDFAIRYYLLHFRLGPFVPWVDASIAPGGSDLNIGRRSNGTRLAGPFLALIQGGAGLSYFVTERNAIYFGIQAQHFSNGSLNSGPFKNFSLNTAQSIVIGTSWFLP
ncbi:MAG: acyloxyacyl hydrolase [Candidatus Binataceae bacterium]